MKVLLIQPAKAPLTLGCEDVHMFEPLALEYIASGLITNHDVRILDMRLEKDLKRVLAEFKPDVVGVTAYTGNVNTAKMLIKEIKTWNAEIFTVVGGHHATVSPKDFFNPCINLIIMGEGVFIFREIIRRLEKNEGFEGICGITYVRGDKIIELPYEPLVDLDTFPFPEKKLTEKYRRHYFAEWMKPLASIRTSKGCPFRCNFCTLWRLTGGRYLIRKPENIVRELLEIKEDFVFFADDESFIDTKRMIELAKLIKESGIKKRYFLFGRSDTIAKAPELLEIWKEIGLERVLVGFEFFRDEDLRYIRKGSNTRNNAAAVKILQSLDIDIYASFIVRQEFSKDDFREFRKYCRSLGLNFAAFSVLTPLPGTDFYMEVKDRMITHNYDYFDFLHTLIPTSLPLREFYEELYYLYKKAIPLSKAISFMKKFPLLEIPSVINRTKRIFNQIRRAYRDYDGYLY